MVRLVVNSQGLVVTHRVWSLFNKHFPSGVDDDMESTEDERLGQISDIASGVDNNNSVVDQRQNLLG